jgi:hypothetical protein
MCLAVEVLFDEGAFAKLSGWGGVRLGLQQVDSELDDGVA